MGEKSIVQTGQGSITLAYCPPFYDEYGNYHDHDSNIRTQTYQCSNGHTWTEKTTGSCWCGWPEQRRDI